MRKKKILVAFCLFAAMAASCVAFPEATSNVVGSARNFILEMYGGYKSGMKNFENAIAFYLQAPMEVYKMKAAIDERNKAMRQELCENPDPAACTPK